MPQEQSTHHEFKTTEPLIIVMTITALLIIRLVILFFSEDDYLFKILIIAITFFAINIILIYHNIANSLAVCAFPMLLFGMQGISFSAIDFFSDHSLLSLYGEIGSLFSTYGGYRLYKIWLATKPIKERKL